MPVTVTNTYYEFDELSESAKEIAIEANRYINTMDIDWWCMSKEEISEDASTLGFIVEKDQIFFDLSDSQGSGAVFDGLVDLDFFLAKKEYALLKALVDDGDLEIEVVILSNSFANHYCHSNTRFIDFAYNPYVGGSSVLEKVEGLLEELEDEISVARSEFCSVMYDQLKNEECFLESDEAMSETFRQNC